MPEPSFSSLSVSAIGPAQNRLMPKMTQAPLEECKSKVGEMLGDVDEDFDS